MNLATDVARRAARGGRERHAAPRPRITVPREGRFRQRRGEGGASGVRQPGITETQNVFG